MKGICNNYSPMKIKQNKIITLNEQQKEIKGKKEWNNEWIRPTEFNNSKHTNHFIDKKKQLHLGVRNKYTKKQNINYQMQVLSKCLING